MKLTHTHTQTLFTTMKMVGFTSGLWESIAAKSKSALWFKCLCRSSATCQNSRSKLDLKPDQLFIPLKSSLFKASCQKLHITGVEQGSEAMGSAAMMIHTPQLSCQMLKMGSQATGAPPREYMLGRWLKPMTKSALREARCNQASKMGMTISTLVDWVCLDASLSAGHHQERLLKWPLRPCCGFKFLFEGVFVSCFLTKQLIHKVPRLIVAQKINQSGHKGFKSCCFLKQNQWLSTTRLAKGLL